VLPHARRGLERSLHLGLFRSCRAGVACLLDGF
jgi:hypothetical protein